MPESDPVRKVAVVGEIPFAGRAVAAALSDAGLGVRILCPDSAAETALKALPQSPVFEIIPGDLGSESAVSSALQDTHGVVFVSPINFGGRMYRPETHVDDTKRVAQAADLHALRKIVYHSGVGANVGAQSKALQHAATAEELVSNSRCEDFRIRTGPLMGRDDGFIAPIVEKARRGGRVMTIEGYGGTIVQPLAVTDFARGIAQIFSHQGDNLSSGIYAFVGPETLTLLELTDAALALVPRMHIKFHKPLFMLRIAASASPKSAFAERVNLLFDAFAVEPNQNDARKFLGEDAKLVRPVDLERELLNTMR